jgi:hypothetical protein
MEYTGGSRRRRLFGERPDLRHVFVEAEKAASVRSEAGAETVLDGDSQAQSARRHVEHVQMLVELEHEAVGGEVDRIEIVELELATKSEAGRAHLRPCVRAEFEPPYAPGLGDLQHGLRALGGVRPKRTLVGFRQRIVSIGAIESLMIIEQPLLPAARR